MSDPESENESIENGTVSEINGIKRVYFDRYWIRYYEPPEETLTAKKNLIAGLTRRTFHHTEPGINTPGENLDLARSAYANAGSEEERRINAAMLAGALFNRATDIFTTVVELESKGVHIGADNELMKECSECLQDAMELGKSVRHFSGNEGIDELWGEPLKAFTMTGFEFYTSRYVKISMTMRDIDRINCVLNETLAQFDVFSEVWPIFENFANWAKSNCETMKTDHDYFMIWPKFVTCSDQIKEVVREISNNTRQSGDQDVIDACEFIEQGRKLITYISGARVPMPDTTARFLDGFRAFNQRIGDSNGG